MAISLLILTISEGSSPLQGWSLDYIPFYTSKSRANVLITTPRPPFRTPPKIRAVEQVVKDHPGYEISTLRAAL